MSILPLLLAPDARLRRRAAPVERVDDAVRRLMDDLLETMYAERGIGLAATQVGEPVRVAVVDVAEEDGGTGAPLRLANPEIVARSEEVRMSTEGCLSVPGLSAEIARAAKVRLRYLDERGAPQELEAQGLFAACFQHEIDHLNGVLFFDHLGAVRRNMIVRRLKKHRRETEAKTGARGSAEADAGRDPIVTL